MSSSQMFAELVRLRSRLKEQGKRVQGRTPLICNDEALYKIAEMCPRKLSDFESIPGIGKTFIENYGEQFLAVIQKYQEVHTEKAVNMDSAAVEILKELEKKLVNINRRNRLLYMPKAANKYAFDLYDPEGINPLDIIFGNGRTFTVCDISCVSDERLIVESSKYRKLTQLLREINKDLRDRGQNDLYIGYPFVIGRIPGENFDVRAPLALFPIAAERTPGSIKLALDESRDVLYNNTLILAYYKFNNISKPLPADVIEDCSASTFIDNLKTFYAEHDIEIEVNETDLKKFTEYYADEFPRFRPGELYLEPCAVLGKFPVCANSIQKDFGEIIKNGEINVLLDDLLRDADKIDYYSETYEGDGGLYVNGLPLKISEHDLIYINDLNSSQETVLAAIDKLDELVIQGPPGTGKSQTITSLIADYVSQDKTVLMVSEKKTALDVVYSRLGHLSKYALLIDDAGNKDLFYRQLAAMVSLGCFTDEEKVETEGLSEKIDSLIKRLESIADTLYEPDEFGIEPYKLYLKNRRIDLSDELELNKIRIINEHINPELLNIKYDLLESIHETFSNESLTEKIEYYMNISEEYPWLEDIRANLSEYETVLLCKNLSELKNGIEDWRRKNPVVRLITSAKIKKEVKNIVQKYFTSRKRQNVKLLFDEIDKVIEGIRKYVHYQELKPLYDRLKEAQRDYFRVMMQLKPCCGNSLSAANNDLFNYILYDHIGRFEARNRALFQEIADFDTIIRSLSEAIAEKQQLTRKKLELILAREMYDITLSKRCGEILRVIESKRKWSISKFIRKFDFEIFRTVKIWLLTPEVVSEIIPLQKGIFDLVVFDEASQMYVEKGIPSILRAKKVVIAGDHKQLRPSNLGSGRIQMDDEDLPEDDEVSAALEEESLLDLARFKYNNKNIMLNFHYRSKYEELIAFSNYAFYKGRLYVSPNIEVPEKPPIEVHKMENAVWSNRSNMTEAKYIVEMIKKFFNERKEEETIGIITFNVNQRDLIDDLIDEECAKSPEFAAQIRTELARKKNGEDIGLFVKNIESVQGDERDVIIFSIGYAKNEEGKLIRNFGWLNQKGGENRLNVAISRARKKIHIVTSIYPDELQVEDIKNDGPRILKKYLEYAFAVSSGDKMAAKRILHSFSDIVDFGNDVSFGSTFQKQVYDALREKGYQVDTGVGIGGYSIDLAVKKDGRYILGIEWDGRLYHSSRSARERDYHRQKYLESRGWRIYRIWSTNWWKNPKQEIEKICALADSLS